MNDEFITVYQAAEIVGCAVGTIRQAAYRGMLPMYKGKGRRYILLNRKELEEWRAPQIIRPSIDKRLIKNPHPKVAELLNH